MTRPRILAFTAIFSLAAVLAWLLFVPLPTWYRPTSAVAPAPLSAESAPIGRRINARLFYVADDGTRLTSIERDVPYGDSTAAQARQIVEAQIAPVAEPLVSAIPSGTTLRALFVSERGEAYVDLTSEVTTMHPGGSIGELLTVYSIVNALTANLPALTGVQILVNGKQVDTLAGHVDLRRPLAKNLGWVR